MRWEDERYVRLYTRDTIDWHFLSFEAQGLMGLLMRKVDRAGLLELGRHGKKGVAAAVGHPGRVDSISAALEELLADGCVAIHDSTLIIPNFIEAQEAKQSDKQRQTESRAKSRDIAAARAKLGPDVTKRDEASQNVTNPQGVGHTTSQIVTPSCAVPSVPSVPENPEETKNQGLGGPTLRDLLDEAFRQHSGQRYVWSFADETAMGVALSRGNELEILRRYRIALTKKYPGFTDFATFVRKWNAYATADPTGPTRQTTGRATEADKDWKNSKYKTTEDGQIDLESLGVGS